MLQNDLYCFLFFLLTIVLKNATQIQRKISVDEEESDSSSEGDMEMFLNERQVWGSAALICFLICKCCFYLFSLVKSHQETFFDNSHSL